MAIMDDLSIKIAEATVPDEIDLAPLMTEAFIQGGKRRDSLFIEQESTRLGAFGLTGDILLFPWILKGIAVTAPLMSQFLSIDECSLEEVYQFLGIIGKQQTKEKANQLPEKYDKLLINLFENFLSELKTSGLPEEQCYRIVTNTLVTLRKNPSVFLEFVEMVATSK